MVNAEQAEVRAWDEVEAIHVMPQFGPEHGFSDCWCHPQIEYCHCGCGAELVVIHNVAH